MKNVFFFHTINSIGGVETFFWELAKKYSGKFDIVVYYLNGDPKQIQRLRKYVRVNHFEHKPIECERAFFNYNLEPFISYVKADSKYEIVHADFKRQKLTPHVDDRIDHYIAVSETAAQSFYEMTGIKCQVCANPLTLEEIKHPPLILCSAQRMTSEKGGERIKELVKRLDREDIKYLYFIFTNSRDKIDSPNVILMQQRLDVRDFIVGCDLFVALSDSEGRCYSVAEKLGYGSGKLLITPCPSFFEQGCNEKNSIVMEYDMSNMDNVISEIVNLYNSKPIEKSFEPIKVKDGWNKLLAKGKPEYVGGKKYLVRTTKEFENSKIKDIRLGCVPKEGTTYYEDDIERIDYLLHWKHGALIEIIDES